VIDSEWAFALFLSKVSVSRNNENGFLHHYQHLKLPDLHATHFTPQLLRDAMRDTIASLNKFAQDAGVCEVSRASFGSMSY